MINGNACFAYFNKIRGIPGSTLIAGSSIADQRASERPRNGSHQYRFRLSFWPIFDGGSDVDSTTPSSGTASLSKGSRRPLHARLETPILVPT
jgi:hypothetical protein